MTESSGNKIRVAIADDHTILRCGLKMFINAERDMQVVGEACGWNDVGSLLAHSRPDVLLLDLGMPGGSGLQWLKRVQGVCPQTRVIVLTMHNEVAFARAALSAGAAGFVSKQSADHELLSAIRIARKGGVFVDPTLAGGLLRLSPRVEATEIFPVLSDREQQVLLLVAKGYGNHEIAARIFLSVKTVETYRTRIAEKLGLRSRAELVRYALATGILSVESALDDELPAA